MPIFVPATRNTTPGVLQVRLTTVSLVVTATGQSGLLFSFANTTAPPASVFTPPPNSNCLSTTFCAGFSCFPSLGPPNSACFPSSTTLAFSPGVCPSGYDIAVIDRAIAPRGVNSSGGPQFRTTTVTPTTNVPPVAGQKRTLVHLVIRTEVQSITETVPSETLAICCPSSFGWRRTSVTAGNAGNAEDFLPCTSALPDGPWTLSLGSVSDRVTATTTTTGSGSQVYAQGISIAWRCNNTDFLSLLPATVIDCPDFTSGVTTGSFTGANLITSTPTESTQPGEANNGSKDTGLGTGAKAGIGVGAAVGALLILGALLLLWKRKRGPDPEPAVDPQTHEKMVDSQAPAPPYEMETPKITHEMYVPPNEQYEYPTSYRTT